MARNISLISFGQILAILSVPIIACGNVSSHGARPADLEGREWQISSYFTKKEQILPFRRIGQKRDAYIGFERGALKGSPGCGQFAGTYQRSGEQLTIRAEWKEQKGTPCSDDERKNAEQILRSFARITQIVGAPAFWHSDALLLVDKKGSNQVVLSPTQPGKDLSELQDSFWHLARLEGSSANFSGVIVWIGKGWIAFSTVSYVAEYAFDYNLSGLEFSSTPPPATDSSDHTQSWRDEQVAEVFANALCKTCCYDLSQGTLTLFGEDRQAIIVLNSLQQRGIENRRWRIAKYRGNESQHGDSEGLIDATELADITFLHGRVEGSPGCGGWHGTYRLSGDHITVQVHWLLAGRCSSEGFVQDDLVDNALKGELRIEERGDQILLRDSTGKARVLLVPY